MGIEPLPQFVYPDHLALQPHQVVAATVGQPPRPHNLEQTLDLLVAVALGCDLLEQPTPQYARLLTLRVTVGAGAQLIEDRLLPGMQGE